MAFSQLQNSMAALKLRLAEIQNKEGQLDAMIAQFRTQVRRLPRQAVYGQVSLDASLAALGEIEERLADAMANRRRLLAIKKTCEEELEALEVVKRVDEARRALADLRKRVRTSGTDDDYSAETQRAEMHRLEQFIAEHSKRAELAITASYQERQPGELN